MKISFAITVCNELNEIKNLLPFLIENKRINDEIVILYDQKNGSEDVIEYLLPFNKLPNVQTWRGIGWNNSFSDWKNKLNEYCNGDYIYQIDADELISDYIIKNIHTILEMNPEVELIYVPRINTVQGLTEQHIKLWNWKVNENGWVNFPDWQGRIYKKGMTWVGKVHEKILVKNSYSFLPTNYEYCLIHNKSIERQEKQNNFYQTL